MESLAQLKSTAERIATNENIIPFISVDYSYSHIKDWCREFLRIDKNIESTSLNDKDKRQRKEDILKSLIEL